MTATIAFFLTLAGGLMLGGLIGADAERRAAKARADQRDFEQRIRNARPVGRKSTVIIGANVRNRLIASGVIAAAEQSAGLWRAPRHIEAEMGRSLKDLGLDAKGQRQ